MAEAEVAGWALAVASTSAAVSVRAVLEHAVGTDLAGAFQVFAGDVVPTLVRLDDEITSLLSEPAEIAIRTF